MRVYKLCVYKHMNGRVRIYNNVRYDLVLDDDTDQNYFDPSGIKFTRLNRMKNKIKSGASSVANSKAAKFVGKKAKGGYEKASGITKRKKQLKGLANGVGILDILKEQEQMENEEMGKIKNKMKQLKQLENLLFNLANPNLTMDRLKRGGALAKKGAKKLFGGLKKAGNFLKGMPGGKLSARGTLNQLKGLKRLSGKGVAKFKKGFGALAGGGRRVGKAAGKVFGAGGKMLGKGAKAAAALAGATAAAIAARTKTPLNDEPGFCVWMLTNLPCCLCLKIFAPTICCAESINDKAKAQAKRDKD